MADLIQLGIFLALLAVGYFAGSTIERRHYASIRRREQEYRDVLALMVRFPFDRTTPQRAFLVYGTVVVSADYFKTFVAGLRNLFGGRFRSYETLMERARREALLRLKAEARRKGSKMVVCVRFETTTIASGWAPAMEVFAYGTALVPDDGLLRLPDAREGVSRLLGDGLVRPPV
ncbi:MAG: YbjQ family protein [Burkholderiaceae bacterium]